MQKHHVRFAISLWRELHDAGRDLPIAVRADTATFRLSDIARQIPPESLPFIYSLRMRITRASYNDYGFGALLAKVPRLTHLSLGVFGKGPFTGPGQGTPLAFICDRAIPDNKSLNSLSLHNMVIRPSSFSGDRWPRIDRLHLIYYHPNRVAHTPIYEVLFAAANLTELSVRVSSSLVSASRELFDIPLGPQHDMWRPRLSSIDVRGSRRHVPTFMSWLLSHPHIDLRTIRVVVNCDTDSVDDIFYEMPEFSEALLLGWDSIVVDLDDLSIELVSDGCGEGVRSWYIRWRLYDWWHMKWVSLRTNHRDISLPM